MDRLFKSLRGLQVFRVLQSPDRNSCIDIFRAFAIISVVLYHFNNVLPYGNLGVDLFFVISGLLIGGLLTKKFQRGEPILFFKFFLQRGFKIWPSYYVFLGLGSLIAFLLYRDLSPSQVIPEAEYPRYIFFYLNYTGGHANKSFGHIWSLCVEEHFYILLPLLFILVQRFFKKPIYLFTIIIFVILGGVICKELVILYTRSKDTYAGTHTRVDALGWGVLLSLIISYYPSFLKRKRMLLLAVAGFILLGLAIGIDATTTSLFYKKVVFMSAIPFSFFLLLAGLYHVDFRGWKIIRFISYYSYNWYLWHLLFLVFLQHYITNDVLCLLIYLGLTFFLAVFFTTIVEEPILRARKKIVDRPEHVVVHPL